MIKQLKNRTIIYVTLATYFSLCLFSCKNDVKKPRGIPYESEASFKSANEDFKQNKAGIFNLRDSADLKYILDSLNINDIYDDAKWKLYCCGCLDTIYFSDYARTKFGFPEFQTTGEMKLFLDVVIAKSKNHPYGIAADYQLIFSPFNYTIKRQADSDLVKNTKYKYYFNHIFFNLYYKNNGTCKPIAFEIDNVYPMDSAPPEHCRVAYVQSVLSNQYQPEIIKYIRKNANKMTPWFLDQAKARGFFDNIKYSEEWIEKNIENKPRDCTDDYHYSR
jgi:hypothetical protein